MRILLGASRAVARVAAAVLLAVVAASVAGRAVFDLTGGAVNLLVPGAIELATYALMVMVFAALPEVALSGLVRVDILIDHLPPLVARPLERLWRLLTMAFGAVLAWLLAEETLLQAGRGDVTQDLEIPLWIFTATATLGAALLALAMLAAAILPGRRPR